MTQWPTRKPEIPACMFKLTFPPSRRPRELCFRFQQLSNSEVHSSNRYDVIINNLSLSFGPKFDHVLVVVLGRTFCNVQILHELLGLGAESNNLNFKQPLDWQGTGQSCRTSLWPSASILKESPLDVTALFKAKHNGGAVGCLIPSAGIAEESVPLHQTAEGPVSIAQHTLDPRGCTAADISFAVSIDIRKPERAVVDRAGIPRLSIGKVRSRQKCRCKVASIRQFTIDSSGCPTADIGLTITIDVAKHDGGTVGRLIPSAGIAEERVPLRQTAKRSVSIAQHTLDPCRCTTTNIGFAVAIDVCKPERAVVDRAASPTLSVGKVG